MRELNIGTKKYTKVVCLDAPGVDGACHEYAISRVQNNIGSPIGEFGTIYFQNGPIEENGVNGCHQGDLLAIVIDRLWHFQAGDFACRENALALIKIEEALYWLNHRRTY